VTSQRWLAELIGDQVVRDRLADHGKVLTLAEVGLEARDKIGREVYKSKRCVFSVLTVFPQRYG